MDLISIARILAPLAPVAASIAGGMVAGPAGAAAAGKLTSLIMGQFGLPATATPGQLSDAVVAAGEETARAKINAAMEQARAEIAGFVEIEKAHTELVMKSLLGTQETMRAELGHEHWFFTGWRPAAGWQFNVFAAVYGTMLMIALALAAFFEKAKPLEVIQAAWIPVAAFLGALAAIVGVYIFARSGEKKIAIENAAPMPNAKPAVASTVKPKLSDAIKKIIPDPAGSRTGVR